MGLRVVRVGPGAEAESKTYPNVGVSSLRENQKIHNSAVDVGSSRECCREEVL